MKPVVMVRHTLRWWNPYTQPPEGMPHFLAEETVPHGVTPRAIEALKVPGDGYAWAVQVLDTKPPRKLSDAAKHSIRRKSLSRRMQSKAPLFAEQMIAAELAANPEYFGGTK